MEDWGTCLESSLGASCVNRGSPLPLGSSARDTYLGGAEKKDPKSQNVSVPPVDV